MAGDITGENRRGVEDEKEVRSEQDMAVWPPSIQRAFEQIHYGGYQDEVIEKFAHRWGNLTLETFQHVLDMAEREDKLIALFAIGYSGAAQAREILLPFLQSSNRMERWASILCLGEMQDEEAFPLLIELLQEGLDGSHQNEDDGWVTGWYGIERLMVARLLGEWGHASAVPALRQTFKKVWALEQQDSVYSYLWYDYEDALANALGRLEAFGALTAIELPARRLRLAMIEMALGYQRIRQRAPLSLLIIFPSRTDFQEEVAGVLERHFGLSKEERGHYIEQYVDDIFARNAHLPEEERAFKEVELRFDDDEEE